MAPMVVGRDRFGTLRLLACGVRHGHRVPVSPGLGGATSRAVQGAVKRAILGLVALDAVLATAAVGTGGLLLLLLLPPAVLLGRRVYST